MSVLGPKPEKLNESKCFPLFTQQRTSPRYFGMSASCHNRLYASQQDGPSCRLKVRAVLLVEFVIARSDSDEAIHTCLAESWIASRSLSPLINGDSAAARFPQ